MAVFRMNGWFCRRLFRRVLVAVVLLSPLLFSGCWGGREPDETAHILFVGLDKGKENVLTMTVLIGVPRTMAGGDSMGEGGGGSGKPVITVSVESRTILTGLDMINSIVERRSTLRHLKVIIFSGELAREGLDRYMAPLMRFPEFRRTIFLAVSQGSARELLEKFQPLMENNPAKYAELLFSSQRYVGFIPFAQIHHFYNDSKSLSVEPVCILVGLQETEQVHHHRQPQGVREGDFLAGQMPHKGGGEMEVLGSAVFRDSKMVGALNGTQTAILNMLRGWFFESLFAFPDPGRPDRFIILRVKKERKPEIKVRLDAQGMPEIRARVPLDAEIISIQSGINYERPEKLAVLERALNLRLEGLAGELVRKTQEEFRADIFGFGFKARRLVATYPQWQAMNWPELYPEARVSITFDTKIRRIGLLRKTTPSGGLGEENGSDD